MSDGKQEFYTLNLNALFALNNANFTLQGIYPKRGLIVELPKTITVILNVTL